MIELLAQANATPGGIGHTEVGLIAGAASAVVLGGFKLATYAIERSRMSEQQAGQAGQAGQQESIGSSRRESAALIHDLPCVEHIERITRLETILGIVRDDTKEIKTDLKALLLRMNGVNGGAK